jgi:hypothetical protein
MNEPVDVTPEGSVVKVFLTDEPKVDSVAPDLDALLAEATALRDSAVTKLMTGKPLTEDEARLMVGAQPPFIPDETPTTLEASNPEGTP